MYQHLSHAGNTDKWRNPWPHSWKLPQELGDTVLAGQFLHNYDYVLKISFIYIYWPTPLFQYFWLQ